MTKEVTNRDLTMWIIGGVCSVAGAVILTGGVRWMTHIDAALAKGVDERSEMRVQQSKNDTTLMHILDGIDDIRESQKDTRRAVGELQRGQNALKARASMHPAPGGLERE